jgi:parvulin-like peptidyl-prolyl isomerase
VIYATCCKRTLVCLMAMLLLAGLAACGPAATPEVIQYTSVVPTLRRTNTPSGPTTPTITPTPYIRPTEASTLSLDQPIVRVGDETITLGQFRQRVRYERFAALDSARRLIERVGVENINLQQPELGSTSSVVAATFAALADSNGFGREVYSTMIRESIIRQEYKTRGLTLNLKDVRDYWVRYFDLQLESDIDAALTKAQDEYNSRAIAYSAIPRDEITRIGEVAVMALDLRPLIGRENADLNVTQVKIRRLVARSQADADAALTLIKRGEPFRSAACQYSIDPAVKGQGGELGFITRGQLPAGLKDSDALFAASTGQIVGPLESQLGWHLFKVKEQRKNADGDTQINAQTILVATQSLANDLKQRAEKGEDFAALACANSLDKTAGNGGDLGYVDPFTLSDEVASAIQASTGYGLIGPIATKQGFEVIHYEDRKTNVPNPEQVGAAQTRAYNTWLSARASSNFVVALNETWPQAIPADPLPRDVSPLMREERFGLPTAAQTAVQTQPATAPPG